MPNIYCLLCIATTLQYCHSIATTLQYRHIIIILSRADANADVMNALIRDPRAVFADNKDFTVALGCYVKKIWEGRFPKAERPKKKKIKSS